MSRRILIAGNWKLHNTIAESVELAKAVAEGSKDAKAEVVVGPVFTALHAVSSALGDSHVGIAAQDVYWEPKGAFTGEVSAGLLKDAGCSHGIVAHSERRQYFGETEETAVKRVATLLENGLSPILCVGETLEQREAGKTLDVVLAQLKGGLEGLATDKLGPLVVAYEPVWAIGTGRTASPADAQEVHAGIRKALAERGDAFADATRVLYGGSVKPGNAADLLGQPDIDGALVGGASLKPDDFLSIIQAAG